MPTAMHAPPHLFSRKQHRVSGYTLVEIMVVVALTLLLLAVAATGAKKSRENQEIKASAFHLAHDLILASQSAQKLNKVVVVRFYKYNPPAIVGQPRGCVHAYQLLVYDPPPPGKNGSNAVDTRAGASSNSKEPDYKPLYEVQTLEGTTLISEESNRFSTLFAVLDGKGEPDQDLGIGPYKFATLEYRPDGSTNLPTPPPENLGPLTLTLIPVRAADHPSEMPKEYATLVIHPENGTVTVY